MGGYFDRIGDPQSGYCPSKTHFKVVWRKNANAKYPFDILYALRTGCQRKAVPRAYGSGSTIHRTFQEWQRAGFFKLMRMISLLDYDENEGIGWEWKIIEVVW